jgi:hypothetical protein
MSMPIGPKSSAAELLELLVARAPALIAAGVTSVSIEGLSATLAPPPPAAGPAPKPQPPAKRHIDPMRDASTYPGGRVPGFTREDLPNG